MSSDYKDMALRREDVLRRLKHAVTIRDVVGVTEWFQAHPFAKVKILRDSNSQKINEETWKLLKDTGRSESADIFDVMLQNVYDSDEYPLHEEEQLYAFMLREGNICCLEKLLNRGCEVNAFLCGLWTPLILLMNKPFQMDKIQYLVSRGADVNQLGTGHVFYGPLHYAVGIDENLEVIPDLLKLGADVNKPSRLTNLTPLHIAMNYDNVNIVDFLIRKGANPRIMSFEAETALDLALQNSCFVRTFLERNIIMPVEGYCMLMRGLSDWSNIDLSTLELLLQTGSKCSRDEWIRIRDYFPVCSSLKSKLGEIEELLACYAFRPRSLLDLACFSVREVMSADFIRLVGVLPIPEVLKQCIKLEHYLNAF